jgi:1-deoxy-D-xylulose-5-phosphate reductoisomerase
MKNICILGSTGSIGQNSLEVIANFPGEFRPACLTTNRNIALLGAQVERFRPDAVAVLDPAAAAAFRESHPSLRVLAGEEGLIELVTRPDIDIVISSLVGFAGLVPTIEAIKRGKTVALANKETLVVAGEMITRLVREHNATLIPIDSEHSAILQCLVGEQSHHIDRLILTASGGPFLNLPKDEFRDVTIERALKHPNWKMGKKITIDSATMMNKGLEIIEAHWLFSLPPGKIDVLIHPQSIIHSMVEFIDGSVKAQLGIPDMKIPIQFALTYPDRARSTYARIDFAKLGSMTFFAPDADKFECLELAYRALASGGTSPAVLNAANEVAVELFLGDAIAFHHIPMLIRDALDRHPSRPLGGLGDIIAADRETRASVRAQGSHLRERAYAST